MTHFFLKFMTVTTVGCMCIVLLAMSIGRMLDEDEIVFSSYHGYGIHRMTLVRGLTAPLMNTKNSVIQPDWSPDGQHIAYVDNGSAQLILYIADWDGGNKRLLTNLPNSSDYDPKWSPDGRYIAYSTSNAQTGQAPVIELMLFDTQTQAKRRLTTTNIFREHMLYWSPDGTQITFVLYSLKRANSDIFSINVSTGAINTLVSTPNNDEYPIWSPDGRFIGFVTGDSQRGIYVLDMITGQSSLLYLLSGVSYPSDWSQDSRFIFFSSVYNVYKLDVADCLSNPKTCTPQLLIKGGADARRKPRLP